MPAVSRYINTLSLRELSERRKALESVLTSEGINYELQEADGIINYEFDSGAKVIRDSSSYMLQFVVPPPHPQDFMSRTKVKRSAIYLFSAHYDNYRLSPGANDNMAAICILIDLCKELESRSIPAKFVLTDAEESHHEGAKLYANTHNMKDFAGVINLDLCGYGDSIVINGSVKPFTNKSVLSRHNAMLVKYLPESDDVIYRKYNRNVMSLSIVPKWDVQYLKALASFGDRLLGQPPEFDLILSQMEITQTFHGGSKDSPEFIQESAMQIVYNYLLDSMSSKEEETEKCGIFSRLMKKLHS